MGYSSVRYKIFYYHWLIKKLLWSMLGQNIARQEIQAEIRGEIRWSQGDANSRQSITSKAWAPVEIHRLIEMGSFKEPASNKPEPSAKLL